MKKNKTEVNDLHLTLEELSHYTGQDGTPAYVAVDGVIYDMTNSPVWKGGKHFKGHKAGYDLSAEIRQSPHGLDNLKRVPMIGTLIDTSDE